MELKLAISIVGFVTVLTVVSGVLQGLVFGGLVSTDPLMWTGCSCVQGLVAGGFLLVLHLFFAMLQTVVLGGLLGRARWAKPAGFALAFIYLCSGLFPFAIVLFVALLRVRLHPVGPELRDPA